MFLHINLMTVLYCVTIYKERDLVMINEQALINIAAPKGITSSDIDVFL